MTPEQEEARAERIAIIMEAGLTQEVAEEIADRWPELYGIRVRTIKQGGVIVSRDYKKEACFCPKCASLNVERWMTKISHVVHFDYICHHCQHEWRTP